MSTLRRVSGIGKMSIARSLTLMYTKGYPIGGFSGPLQFIGGAWGNLIGAVLLDRLRQEPV